MLLLCLDVPVLPLHIVFCSDKETLQQYKRDITGVCSETVDEEAGTGGETIDDAATVGGGCEGCVLRMQSSVQACCLCTYAEDMDQ